MTIGTTDSTRISGWTAEFFLHLLFFAAAAAVLVLSFNMSVVGSSLVYLPGSSIPLPESCTARLFLGIHCPGCGLTRAFISISHGQFPDAWNYNPASFMVYLFVVVQLPWQAIQMTRIRQGKPSVDALWIYFLPISMAILLLAQWLYRMFLN